MWTTCGGTNTERRAPHHRRGSRRARTAAARPPLPGEASHRRRRRRRCRRHAPLRWTERRRPSAGAAPPPGDSLAGRRAGAASSPPAGGEPAQEASGCARGCCAEREAGVDRSQWSRQAHASNRLPPAPRAAGRGAHVVPRVGLGANLQEQVEALEVTPLGRGVQRCPPLGVRLRGGAGVSEEKLPELVHVPAARDLVGATDRSRRRRMHLRGARRSAARERSRRWDEKKTRHHTARARVPACSRLRLHAGRAKILRRTRQRSHSRRAGAQSLDTAHVSSPHARVSNTRTMRSALICYLQAPLNATSVD